MVVLFIPFIFYVTYTAIWSPSVRLKYFALRKYTHAVCVDCFSTIISRNTKSCSAYNKLKGFGSIPCRERDISFLWYFPDQLWADPSSSSVGITQKSSDCLTKLTTHIHLVLSLRMSVVILHCPIYLYGQVEPLQVYFS